MQINRIWLYVALYTITVKLIAIVRYILTNEDQTANYKPVRKFSNLQNLLERNILFNIKI